jgi:putative DNA primase/helicase
MSTSNGKLKNGRPGTWVFVNAEYGETQALRDRGLSVHDAFADARDTQKFVSGRKVIVTYREANKSQGCVIAGMLNRGECHPRGVWLCSLDGLNLDEFGSPKRLAAELRRISRPAPGPSHNGDGILTKPAIEVTTARHVVVEEAIRALMGDPEMFSRGGTLGTVVEEAGDVATLPGGVELANAQGSSRFLPLSESCLGCHLTKAAMFFGARTDKNGEEFTIDVHPPDWLIKAIATRGYWPGIRPLLGIAECPYVRSDGLIPLPGYDPATGVLYRPSVKLPKLPDRPTQDDAREARNRLNDVVGQFPFATGFDWSVWLAALLTSIQRPAIAGPVPGFAFNGNKAGVGKGLLIDAIGIIVYGHGIPTRTYPSEPSEAGKVKLSLALAATPAVHFDNLPEGGFYGSSELDSAITSTVVSDRILGQSRDSGSVPLRPVWMLSGNNVSPSRDAFRRWLPCNLTTPLESPHERDDIEVGNLRQHVAECRAKLIGDALVILKAHALAGHPNGGWAPLGSFEAWDRIVRGAVHFATGNDCLHTQRQGAAESPERLDKLALLEGWSQLPEGGSDGKGVTVEDAIQTALDNPVVYSMLHSALMRMKSAKEKIPSAKTIGYRIRGMDRQNVGGFRFELCGKENHSRLWRVNKL